MKKAALTLLLILMTSLILAASLDFDQNPGFNILSSTTNGLTVNYGYSNLYYNQVATNHGNYTLLSINGATQTNAVGQPSLPLMRQIIAVPLGAQVITRVQANSIKEYTLSGMGVSTPVMPAQPSVAKNQDPTTVAWHIDNQVYNRDQYQGLPLVSTTELGMLRGLRLFAVDVVPVDYNPVTGSLKVYNNIDVDVTFAGGDMAATRQELSRTASVAYDSIYKHYALNSDAITEANLRSNFTRYPQKMIIISARTFQSQLQPFIQWKKQQGFNVIERYTDETGVGATTTSIKAYLQSVWNAATADDPAPSYLLLVGDTPQIPAWTGSTDSGHVTDLNYCKLSGTDYMPEMMYGRFSARTTADLQPQIDKTLAYEQLTLPSTDYMNTAIMIAGVDDNYSPTYANGQINYGTNQYFNTAHGITSHTYLYPASNQSTAASQIIANINAGAGFANYTAHGDWNEWYNPNLTNSTINGLTNANKYPFVVGNCCLTNKFDETVCFSETWLRAANKGSIGYIGGTNSTYWDEDYWWGVGYSTVSTAGPTYAQSGIGVYDGLFHTHGEDFSLWYTTAASLIINGNLAVTQGNSSRINYYWEIYGLMGDPTLTVNTTSPHTATATLPEQMFIGQSTLSLAVDPYAYGAVTVNGEIVATALADGNGNLALPLPFTAPTTAHVVVTCQNMRPLVGDISILPNTSAYVIYQACQIADGNDGVPQTGEQLQLQLSLENVGVMDATNATVTLSTEDSYASVLGGNLTVDSLPAGAVTALPGTFAVALADNIPDQHEVPFTVLVSTTEGDFVWTSTFDLVANAPAFTINDLVINDGTGGNHLFNAGEEGTIELPITNSGNYASQPVTVRLIADESVISLTPVTTTFNALAPNGQAFATYEYSIPDGVTVGTPAVIGVLVSAGRYSATATLSPAVGIRGETFESGNFSQNNWTSSGTAWTVVNTGAHGGTYCAKAGTITHNGTSSMILTTTNTTAGNITFYEKVSSESGYDFLKFYINNTETGSWSGTGGDWSLQSYTMPTTGSVQLKWTYSKDGSDTSGSDTAWIDDIALPGGGTASLALMAVDADSLNFGTVTDPVNSRTFSVYNLGNAAGDFTMTVPNGFAVDGTRVNLPAGQSLLLTASFTGTENMEYSGDIIVTGPNGELTVHVYRDNRTISAQDQVAATGINRVYPNPFNPRTTVAFSLRQAGPVHLNVYNVRGQLVNTLVNGQMEAGQHLVTFKGQDNAGKNLASGVYFIRMEADKKVSTQKMLLLK